MTYIFVYGTLKRGYSNYSRFLKNQEFVCEAKTKPNYRLFHNGSFPMIVRDGVGYSVMGEIFKVDDDCLQHLDWLEGVNHGFYARMPVQLETAFDKEVNSPVMMYHYNGATHKLEELVNGTWPPAQE